MNVKANFVLTLHATPYSTCDWAKLIIFCLQSLDLDTEIEAANGKGLQAIAVFAHSIKFLKDKAVHVIRQKTEDDSFKVEDVQWVLTVPAIWHPKAKQFMRKAAHEVRKYRTNLLKD